MTRIKRILFFCLCALYPIIGTAQQETFPYPEIPTVLQTPAERGAYLLEHYWDGINFTDTTLIHKPDITEQGFANFIDMLPRVDSVAAERGVETFVVRTFGSKGIPTNVTNYFDKLTDHYLYDPNSPMRSDVLYAMFLRHMLKHGTTFGTAERERMAYRLRNVIKNLPGTVATDFSYIDRQGLRRTLHTTEGEYTMLYFNDPNCENCHEITAEFSQDSLLTANPRLTVLAVYPDEDTELWRQKPQPFPKTWIDAYSPKGEINTLQLYFIRATPTIYLLDKDKRVILKDPTPQTLREYVKAITANNSTHR